MIPSKGTPTVQPGGGQLPTVGTRIRARPGAEDGAWDPRPFSQENQTGKWTHGIGAMFHPEQRRPPRFQGQGESVGRLGSLERHPPEAEGGTKVHQVLRELPLGQEDERSTFAS